MGSTGGHCPAEGSSSKLPILALGSDHTSLPRTRWIGKSCIYPISRTGVLSSDTETANQERTSLFPGRGVCPGPKTFEAARQPLPLPIEALTHVCHLPIFLHMLSMFFILSLPRAFMLYDFDLSLSLD